jgi:hypothetical protein
MSMMLPVRQMQELAEARAAAAAKLGIVEVHCSLAIRPLWRPAVEA